LLLGAASPSPNPFPFLVESSSQQQRWLPRPASCRRLRRSSMVQQQQQPSPVSAVRAVPIRGRGPPSTRPSVRRGRFPRPPARLPVPEPSSPGCRSSSAWLPSAWISTGAACRGFFRRRPLWLLLARRRRSARPRPSTAAVRSARHRHPAVADPADSYRLHPQAPSRLPSSRRPDGSSSQTARPVAATVCSSLRLPITAPARPSALFCGCSVLPSASALCSVLLLCSAAASINFPSKSAASLHVICLCCICISVFIQVQFHAQNS